MGGCGVNGFSGRRPDTALYQAVRAALRTPWHPLIGWFRTGRKDRQRERVGLLSPFGEVPVPVRRGRFDGLWFWEWGPFGVRRFSGNGRSLGSESMY